MSSGSVAKKTKDFNSHVFLRSLREFSAIPSKELESLAKVSRIITLKNGEYITSEGQDESLYGFIVVSGHLAMLKTSPDGKQLIVELLQANDIFGLLLMLASERLPAQLSARALQNRTILLLIPIRDFQNFLEAHPSLLKEFVAHLLLCLQSSYSLSRGLAHDKVEVRIASVLASLSLKYLQTEVAKPPYTIHFTRQQLADFTGTTPETAIRVTRHMQRQGLIDIRRPGIIHVLDLPALQEIAELP